MGSNIVLADTATMVPLHHILRSSEFEQRFFVPIKVETANSDLPERDIEPLRSSAQYCILVR